MDSMPAWTVEELAGAELVEEKWIKMARFHALECGSATIGPLA